MSEALAARTQAQLPARTPLLTEQWALEHARRERRLFLARPAAPPAPLPAARPAPRPAPRSRGPVGTGKSSILATLCRELAGELAMAVVTSDIHTDEDARFLRSAGVLPTERIRAVETGACPHTAIRDDVSADLDAVEGLEEAYGPLDLVLVESGGDNLTATFSPALADAQLFCLDVAGGGDVAREGGPGITGADVLIVDKTDPAPHAGVDVGAMVADARSARDGLPVLALSRHDPASIAELADWVRSVLARHRDGTHIPTGPGPMAPHSHAHHHDS